MQKDDVEKIITSSRIISLLIKIPDYCLNVVLGENGDVIENIADKTGTKIKFCNSNQTKRLKDFFSMFRQYQDPICIITGKEASVSIAAAIITDIILSQPTIDNYVLSLPFRQVRKLQQDSEFWQIIQIISKADIVVKNTNRNSNNSIFDDDRGSYCFNCPLFHWRFI